MPRHPRRRPAKRPARSRRARLQPLSQCSSRPPRQHPPPQLQPSAWRARTHGRRLPGGPSRRLFSCLGTQTQTLGIAHPHLLSSLRWCPAKRPALGQGLCRSRRWGHLCGRLQQRHLQAWQPRPLHRRSPGCSCRRCRLLHRRLPARHLRPLRLRFQGCSCQCPPKCRSRQRCRWRPRKQALQAVRRQKP